MDDFDQRAKRAGQLLVASVRELEPGLPPPPRQRVRAPVAVAAIALVGVIAVGLYLRRDDQQIDVTNGETFLADATGQYFVPQWVPEGLSLTGRRDVNCAIPVGTVSEGNDPPGSPLLCRDEVWYLTYESSDGSRYVSITRERRLSEPVPDPQEVAVAVRGREGRLSMPTPSFVRLYWAEDDHTTLVINAAGQPIDDVMRIAEGLVSASDKLWGQLEATPRIISGPPLGLDERNSTLLIEFTLPSGDVAQLWESFDRGTLCFSVGQRGCFGGGGERLGFDTHPPWPRYAGSGGSTGGPFGAWSYYLFDAPVGFPKEFSVRTVGGRSLGAGMSVDGRFILVVDPTLADRDLLEAVDPDGNVITRLYAAGRNRA